MKIIRFLFGFLAIPAAALAGNRVGGQIRFKLTGERVATIHYEHTTANGIHMDNYPVNTKFIPAMLIAFLGRPRWLFAFLGGILASLWIDDQYEAIFLELVIAPLVVNPIIKKISTSQRS